MSTRERIRDPRPVGGPTDDPFGGNGGAPSATREVGRALDEALDEIDGLVSQQSQRWLDANRQQGGE